MPRCRHWRGASAGNEAGARRRPARVERRAAGTRPWPTAGQALAAAGARVLATVLDNGAAFVALDEAALQRGIVHVPLPQFFSAAQMQHALQAAGVDTLLVAAPLATAWPGLGLAAASSVAGEPLMHARLPAAEVAMPAHTAKISFTSGTTGAPKGVCLSAAALQRVAQRAGRGDGAAAHRAPPECLALCRAAGKHRRPDGSAPAWRDRRLAAAWASWA